MNTTRSLRLRLIFAYVAALFAGLICFAAAAVFAIDRSERSGLDAHLNATARALSALLDLRTGSPTVDKDDRSQFVAALGPQSSGVVVDASGRIILSNVASPPAAMLGAAGATAAYFSSGSGESELRAFVMPIRSAGRYAGKIVVWRPSDWIDETDRDEALAFLIAALAIAALAWFAGNAVTHRALEEAVARQRRFTADASHELRAPLAVIRAESDLALSRPREANAYRDALNAISQEADRMETLVGGLLSVARAEAAGLSSAEIDLNELVIGACERMRGAAQAKRVALDAYEIPQARIAGDAPAIERAILGILHNALKHAPEGGRIEARIAKEGREIALVVRDNGGGFSPDALEHGLERFWRGNPAAGSGSGLGLALADAVVRAAGGRVELRNDGCWAEARLSFPAA